MLQTRGDISKVNNRTCAVFYAFENQESKKNPLFFLFKIGVSVMPITAMRIHLCLIVKN